jgi:hypothetical protein
MCTFRFSRNHIRAGVILAIFAASALILNAQVAPKPSLITEKADEGKLRGLAGNTRPEATAENGLEPKRKAFQWNI